MTRAEKRKEITKVNRFVKAAEKAINAMEIIPRDPWKFPFEIVALANVSKAFALAKACLVLLRSDSPDEAFGLSRSIVECSNNLRYMTEKSGEQDKRVRAFVKQHTADKAFWAHYCLELFSGKPEEQDIRDYMKQEGITPDTKPASNHWSGERGFIWKTTIQNHPLDGAATLKHRKISHAADYFQTSTFVHCSPPAIDNYAVDEGKPFRISTTTGLHETTQSTLYTILIYLYSTIRYALYGMNTDSPRITTMFNRLLVNSMKPVERRFSKTKHSL